MAAPVGRRKRADILAEVLRYLQSGMTRRAACGLAGIDRSTLTRWIEHSNTVLRQVQSAEAAAEGRATALLVRAANDDWRAALAWLERRRPQEWAPRRTELSIAEEVSEPRHVTVDAVEAIVAFLPDESRGPVLEGWPTTTSRVVVALLLPEALYGQRPSLLARDLELELDPWQAEALNDRHGRTLLNCARQSGKSTVMALKATWYALFQPGSLSLVCAPTQDQSDELLAVIHRLYRTLGKPVALTAENVRSLRLLSGSRIVSLPGDARPADHVRGFSNVNLMCIDEAARTSDELVEAVRPMLAVSGGQIVASSTPAGKRGWWYQAWMDASQDWRRVEVPATACSRIPAAFLERERRELGERHFNAEYCCSFEENETALFPESVLEQLADPEVQDWSGWLHADDLDKGAVGSGSFAHR